MEDYKAFGKDLKRRYAAYFESIYLLIDAISYTSIYKLDSDVKRMMHKPTNYMTVGTMKVMFRKMNSTRGLNSVWVIGRARGT